ncbi:hypothetical protein [Streptosporangium carneum]|uniref:Uncharacterized protein n=1 Tax=Streptosporangium carneum TaxID=47481 RepID=A0A9W6I8D9_9ACTN|nr:hypothetical protein [Streptosporangium carneum]GLK13281.1 hypothetical protein GCM10017600_66920 [Streptosporangium carneum]
MLQTILLVLGLFAVLVSMVSFVEGTSVPSLISDLRAEAVRARRLRRSRRDNAVYPYFYDVGLRNRTDGQPSTPTGGQVNVGGYRLDVTPMPEGMCPLYTLHHHNTGDRVPCTGEEALLWREAAIEYATALREAGATLRAAHERARLRLVRLLPGGRSRVASELLRERGRFREQALAAAAAYRPVHDEIEHRLRQQRRRHERRIHERRIEEEPPNPRGRRGRGGEADAGPVT